MFVGGGGMVWRAALWGDNDDEQIPWSGNNCHPDFSCHCDAPALGATCASVAGSWQARQTATKNRHLEPP